MTEDSHNFSREERPSVGPFIMPVFLRLVSPLIPLVSIIYAPPPNNFLIFLAFFLLAFVHLHSARGSHILVFLAALFFRTALFLYFIFLSFISRMASAYCAILRGYGYEGI